MTPCSLRIRRRASAVAGALLLAGCAARTAEPVAVPTTSSPRPASTSVTRAGRSGFVVAALPGGGDAGTDAMAGEIARRTGFALVVAAEPGEAEKRVLEAAQGPLRFYAEIYGTERRDCAGQIEIATVGIDRELALRLRTLAELIRDAHLRANRDVQRLEVLIEPADPVAYRAAGARILRLPQRALHIELPRCARRDWREAYTSILADFLAQAVSLPVGR